MEDNLLKLLMKRRSIRKFKEEKPSKELVDMVLKAGLLAPSSKNKKPVEFILVEDKNILLKLKESKTKGIVALETAPFIIVVIGDSEKSDVWVEDTSIAASYMQLEAEELGLGTVWIQIRKRFNEMNDSEAYVKKALNIPHNYGVLCIIAVGYKNETVQPYETDDIDFSKVHFNLY